LADVPQCLTCGTCCFSELEFYVRVTGDDYERLGERAEELVRFDGHRAYMRMVHDRCVALRVDASSGQFSCGAYEIRPAVCRELIRGSSACLGEIDSKAQRPLVALRRARDLD
jgi:Fe-S-cluster containining protein